MRFENVTKDHPIRSPQCFYGPYYKTKTNRYWKRGILLVLMLFIMVFLLQCDYHGGFNP